MEGSAVYVAVTHRRPNERTIGHHGCSYSLTHRYIAATITFLFLVLEILGRTGDVEGVTELPSWYIPVALPGRLLIVRHDLMIDL